jgi:hypothetical protein
MLHRIAQIRHSDPIPNYAITTALTSIGMIGFFSYLMLFMVAHGVESTWKIFFQVPAFGYGIFVWGKAIIYDIDRVHTGDHMTTWTVYGTFFLQWLAFVVLEAFSMDATGFSIPPIDTFADGVKAFSHPSLFLFILDVVSSGILLPIMLIYKHGHSVHTMLDADSVRYLIIFLLGVGYAVAMWVG